MQYNRKLDGEGGRRKEQGVFEYYVVEEVEEELMCQIQEARRCTTDGKNCMRVGGLVKEWMVRRGDESLVFPPSATFCPPRDNSDFLARTDSPASSALPPLHHLHHPITSFVDCFDSYSYSYAPFVQLQHGQLFSNYSYIFTIEHGDKKH